LTMPSNMVGNWYRKRTSDNDTNLKGVMIITAGGHYVLNYTGNCCGGMSRTTVTSCFCGVDEKTQTASTCCGAAQLIFNNETKELELHHSGMIFVRNVMNSTMIPATTQARFNANERLLGLRNTDQAGVVRANALQQLLALKAAHTCSSCHRSMSSSSRFCEHCGAAVPDAPAVPSAVMQTCMKCSAVNRGLHAFCNVCGHPMASLQQTSTTAAMSMSPIISVNSTATVVPTAQMVIMATAPPANPSTAPVPVVIMDTAPSDKPPPPYGSA